MGAGAWQVKEEEEEEAKALGLWEACGGSRSEEASCGGLGALGTGACRL